MGVAGAQVLYLGKAFSRSEWSSKSRQASERVLAHESGHPVGHWGGRYLWQLEDSGSLLVAWAATPDVDAEDVQSELINESVTRLGQPPIRQPQGWPPRHPALGDHAALWRSSMFALMPMSGLCQSEHI